MATKKKRKAAPAPKSKAGRKKEIKRFELEKLVGGDESNEALEANEIAFVVRTSGGTPLNTTDTGKLFRLIQHELRKLGHKLKRKGQDLDPEPEPEKASTSAPEPTSADGDLGDDDRAEEEQELEDSSQTTSPDPDDRTNP